MSKILIFYRREDSTSATGRIYDRLVEAFDRDSVFKDVDSIPPGNDFRTYIAEQLGKCRVCLAVIGRDWMKTRSGKKRLDDPDDFVRLEIESALKRKKQDKIVLIPLLVEGASMPSAKQLPQSIEDLSYLHAFTIRDDPHFNNDMNELINRLKGHIRPPGDQCAEMSSKVIRAGKSGQSIWNPLQEISPGQTPTPILEETTRGGGVVAETGTPRLSWWRNFVDDNLDWLSDPIHWLFWLIPASLGLTYGQMKIGTLLLGDLPAVTYNHWNDPPFEAFGAFVVIFLVSTVLLVLCSVILRPIWKFLTG
jgi:TIR domain